MASNWADTGHCAYAVPVCLNSHVKEAIRKRDAFKKGTIGFIGSLTVEIGLDLVNARILSENKIPGKDKSLQELHSNRTESGLNTG